MSGTVLFVNQAIASGRYGNSPMPIAEKQQSASELEGMLAAQSHEYGSSVPSAPSSRGGQALEFQSMVAFAVAVGRRGNRSCPAQGPG